MEDIQKKKGNTGLVVLVVVLTILLLGAIGYICYDKGVFNDLLGKEKQIEEPKKEQEEDKLSVLEVETLIKTIPYSNWDGAQFKDPYIGTLITIDNIDYRLLLEYAFNKVKSDVKNLDTNKFDAKLLEKVFKDAYNIDNVKHQDFLNYRYDSSNNQYIMKGGWGGPNESQLLSKLVDYKIENDELIVLEKIGFVIWSNNGTLITTDRVSSSDKIIKEIKYNEETEEYEPDSKEYFNNNLDKFNTFKHTFKKASDGKYYWYSSEIVNE